MATKLKAKTIDGRLPYRDIWFDNIALNDWSKDLVCFVTNVDGWWGPPEASIPIDDKPYTEDGSYLVPGRNLGRTVEITGVCLPRKPGSQSGQNLVVKWRDRLVKALNKVRKTGTLTFYEDSGTKQLKVQVRERPLFDFREGFSDILEYNISFYAADPKKYASKLSKKKVKVTDKPWDIFKPVIEKETPDEILLTSTGRTYHDVMVGTKSYAVFNRTYNNTGLWQNSKDSSYLSKIMVYNSGNVDTYGTIVMRGPVVNPAVKHLDQNKVLQLNIALTADQTAHIDLDEKTILLGDGTGTTPKPKPTDPDEDVNKDDEDDIAENEELEIGDSLLAQLDFNSSWFSFSSGMNNIAFFGDKAIEEQMGWSDATNHVTNPSFENTKDLDTYIAATNLINQNADINVKDSFIDNQIQVINSNLLDGTTPPNVLVDVNSKSSISSWFGDEYNEKNKSIQILPNSYDSSDSYIILKTDVEEGPFIFSASMASTIDDGSKPDKNAIQIALFYTSGEGNLYTHFEKPNENGFAEIIDVIPEDATNIECRVYNGHYLVKGIDPDNGVYKNLDSEVYIRNLFIGNSFIPEEITTASEALSVTPMEIALDDPTETEASTDILNANSEESSIDTEIDSDNFELPDNIGVTDEDEERDFAEENIDTQDEDDELDVVVIPKPTEEPFNGGLIPQRISYKTSDFLSAINPTTLEYSSRSVYNVYTSDDIYIKINSDFYQGFDPDYKEITVQYSITMTHEVNASILLRDPTGEEQDIMYPPAFVPAETETPIAAIFEKPSFIFDIYLAIDLVDNTIPASGQISNFLICNGRYYGSYFDNDTKGLIDSEIITGDYPQLIRKRPKGYHPILVAVDDLEEISLDGSNKEPEEPEEPEEEDEDFEGLEPEEPEEEDEDFGDIFDPTEDFSTEYESDEPTYERINYALDPKCAKDNSIIITNSGKDSVLMTPSHIDSDWSEAGTAIKVGWENKTTSSGSVGYDIGSKSSLESGTTYTVTQRVYISHAGTINLDISGIDSSVVTDITPSFTAKANSTALIWMTFVCPDYLKEGTNLSLSTSVTGDNVWFAFSDIDIYEGSYQNDREWFCGDSSTTLGTKYSWESAPDNSISHSIPIVIPKPEVNYILDPKPSRVLPAIGNATTTLQPDGTLVKCKAGAGDTGASLLTTDYTMLTSEIWTFTAEIEAKTNVDIRLGLQGSGTLSTSMSENTSFAAGDVKTVYITTQAVTDGQYTAKIIRSNVAGSESFIIRHLDAYLGEYDPYRTWFSGDTQDYSDGLYDILYSWDGEENNSFSRKTIILQTTPDDGSDGEEDVTPIVETPDIITINHQSTEFSIFGSTCLALTPPNNPVDGFVEAARVECVDWSTIPNGTVTVYATVSMDGNRYTTYDHQKCIGVRNDGAVYYSDNATEPNQMISLKFNKTSDDVSLYLIGGAVGSSQILFDGILVVDGDYTDRFFMGGMELAVWKGTEHDSVSIQTGRPYIQGSVTEIYYRDAWIT